MSENNDVFLHSRNVGNCASSVSSCRSPAQQLRREASARIYCVTFYRRIMTAVDARMNE